MPTAAETVIALQAQASQPVAVTEPNPLIVQITANLVKLDDRGLRTVAAMVKEFVRFNVVAK